MKKKTISIGAILFAGVLAAGVCCMGYAARGENGKWFGNGNISTWHWSEKTEGTAESKAEGKEESKFDGDKAGAGGMRLTADENNGISIMSYSLPASEYEDFGFSPQTDTAYMLQATPTPADSVFENVSWLVAWKNPASAWAIGKTVTDYVTVTAAAGNELCANLACLQAFGEQVSVTVTGYGRTEISATCTCDYAKRVTAFPGGKTYGAQKKFPGQTETFTSESEYIDYLGDLVDVTGFYFSENAPTYSAYTLDDNFIVNYSVRFSSEFLARATAALGKTVTMKTGSALEDAKSFVFGACSRGLLDFLAVEGISDWNYDTDPDVLKAIIQPEAWLINECVAKGDVTDEIMLVMTATGEYSTYCVEIPLRFIPDAFVTYASGVELDQGNIVF